VLHRKKARSDPPEDHGQDYGQDHGQNHGQHHGKDHGQDLGKVWIRSCTTLDESFDKTYRFD